jgi:hypothetical protein
VAESIAVRIRGTTYQGYLNSKVVNDDDLFYDEFRKERPLYDFQPKEVVYHYKCEQTIGTASGVVYETPEMGMMIYCFGCKTLSTRHGRLIQLTLESLTSLKLNVIFQVT